ncbi:hypothetical protein [Armatimonas sp.]|uniref:hypothetical protein n=1 Tax=Armatimonas sp. TaxID=1872638 RepID=UPI00286C45DE|nr:hypothetical protein [Armatimonas sp.]
MKRFNFLLIQFLIFLLCLFLINEGVRYATRNSIARQHIQKVEKIPQGASLFLGHSLIVAGIVPELLSWDSPALNAGLGYSGPGEHYLIWRLASTKKPRRVIYGFIDTMLTDSIHGGWDDLVGNRTISYLIQPKLAKSIYGDSAWLLEVIAPFPALVERKQIWLKVELLRRKLGQWQMPVQEENSFGRVADFAALEQNRIDFLQKCMNPIMLNNPIESFITDLNFSSTESWFVLMPLPSQHRHKYYETAQWIQYRSYLFDLLKKKHIHCLDASDWIDDHDFKDVVHLNEKGARRFSDRLAKVLQGQVTEGFTH